MLRALHSLSYRCKFRSGKKIRRILAVCILVLSVGCFALSEWALSAVPAELVSEAAEHYVVAAINSALNNAMNTDETFAAVKSSADGGISSVEVDEKALSSVRAAVSDALEEELNKRITIFIPAGSLLNSAVLSGRGPGIPVRLSLEGSAQITFSTDFVSAGVNQSCHRIIMNVKAAVCSFSTRFYVNAEAESSAVISETVVVGSVPQYKYAG